MCAVPDQSILRGKPIEGPLDPRDGDVRRREMEVEMKKIRDACLSRVSDSGITRITRILDPRARSPAVKAARELGPQSMPVYD